MKNKKEIKKINIARYKYFLLYLLESYDLYGYEITLNYKHLEISRSMLYKYRDEAIKDNILEIKVINKIKKNDKIYNQTYSYKNKIAKRFKINITNLKNKLNELKDIKEDWTTLHRSEKYTEYLKNIKLKNEQKYLKGIRKYNLDKVRIDIHLSKYKIANSEKDILQALDFKYPFIKEYQKDLEIINQKLPEPLQIKFKYKITPTNNKKYIKKISIRATNRLCGVISDEKLTRLPDETKISKNKILEKYNLYNNEITPDNDTPSSIPRIIWSCNNKKWLEEDYNHCCYRQVLDLVVKKYKNCSYFDLDKKTQINLRNGFKKLILELLFCDNYKQQIDRNILLRNEKFRDYYNLIRYIVELKSIRSYECCEQIKNIMYYVAESLYIFLGTGSYNYKFINIEIFLWESILEIEMVKELYKLYPDLIFFMQYDSLYINKPYKNFKKLRKEIFENKILPLYLKYNCYNENQLIREREYKEKYDRPKK